MITVLLVDDHPIVVDGLAALIDTVDGMTVVATASSGPDAVERATEHQPAVVLMDLNMPGGSGIEATREIARRCPDTNVVVLTLAEDHASISAALQAGARGYLLKGSRQTEIVRAVETIATGGVLFSATVADHVLGTIKRGAQQRPTAKLPPLTDRERDILELLAQGWRNASIGDRLGISNKTVANHLSMIFVKLQVEDRAGAIILARAAGLGVDTPPDG